MIIDPQALSPAERLLWSYGVTEPVHIDLDAIALDRGAQVRYRRLDGCEARLVVSGDRAIISVNDTSQEGRRRFSLGHELAHWICDRGRGSFLCANDDIGPQNAEAKHVEALANSYASQLILPDYLVQSWIQGKPISLDTASALRKDFKASLTAAAIKLAKRARQPACVACHGQSKLHWFVKNRAFPTDIYMSRELHQDTDAFSIVFGGMSGMGRPKREPANRWLTGSGVFRMTVQSQSLGLSDSATLTLIALVN